MRRFLFLVPAALFALSGCVIHNHYGYRPDAINGEYQYYGAHPIPEDQGGGWCTLDGEHVHLYPPDYDYYAYNGDAYAYTGPMDVWYDDFHPIPGGGFCYLTGHHCHNYLPAPGFGASFTWSGGGYAYRGPMGGNPGGGLYVPPPSGTAPGGVPTPPGIGGNGGVVTPPGQNPPPGHGGEIPGHGGLPPGWGHAIPPGQINNPGHGIPRPGWGAPQFGNPHPWGPPSGFPGWGHPGNGNGNGNGNPGGFGGAPGYRPPSGGWTVPNAGEHFGVLHLPPNQPTYIHGYTPPPSEPRAGGYAMGGGFASHGGGASAHFSAPPTSGFSRPSLGSSHPSFSAPRSYGGGGARAGGRH